MGVVYALGPHVAYWVERVLRVYVGLTGALILLIAAVDVELRLREARALAGEHGQLPRRFGRLSRRSLHSPEAVVAARADLDGPPPVDGVHARIPSPSSRASSASACSSPSPLHSSRS